MALEIYRRKRDFHRTPEPRGVTGKSRGTRFVIDKHAELQSATLADQVPSGTSHRVSAPLFWHELDSCRGDTFNLKNIGARLAQLKSDPWADYEASRRPLTAVLRKKIAA